MKVKGNWKYENFHDSTSWEGLPFNLLNAYYKKDFKDNPLLYCVEIIAKTAVSQNLFTVTKHLRNS